MHNQQPLKLSLFLKPTEVDKAVRSSVASTAMHGHTPFFETSKKLTLYYPCLSLYFFPA